MTTIDDRVERLLDQLENPNLSDREATTIRDKIEFLREQQS